MIKTTNILLNKNTMSAWIQRNYKNYFQKYNLSCEAALIRLVISALGVTHLSEDNILSLFPRHATNPELGLVIQEIDGEVSYPDGSINWQNYGAHAPVVLKVLKTIFTEYSLDNQYSLEITEADDKKLSTIIKDDKNCLGAIVWVAGYINGKQPPVNARGQVLGEHVQFVAPLLDSRNRFVVYDVWPWPDQPFRLYSCLNRDLFKYKTLILRTKIRTGKIL